MASMTAVHHPVTVVVTRRVRPGMEEKYEDWLRRQFADAEHQPGYMGAEVVDLVEGDASWHRLSGLEFWFTPPKGTVVPQAARWRMALVTMLTVYFLVMTAGQVVIRALAGTPFAVRMAALVIVQVVLMTYVFMPRVTRLMARWIYPAVRPTHT